MTDLDALLLAVLHHPADDVARLIYADRLDETGVSVNAARAEFIRLQVAGEGPDRQRELAAEWLADWFGRPVFPAGGEWWAVGQEGERDALQLKVSRGFISAVATHGLYAGEWSYWTPWQVGEAFAAAVADVFNDHPVERIVLDIGDTEDWWIAEPDATRWTAYRQDQDRTHVLCFSPVGRSTFATDLCAALCSRTADLAAWAHAERSHQQAAGGR